eukprot:4513290-Ditylum_brightwellii.AAC.1
MDGVSRQSEKDGVQIQIEVARMKDLQQIQEKEIDLSALKQQQDGAASIFQKDGAQIYIQISGVIIWLL